MVDINEALKVAMDSFPFDTGAFYGHSTGLALGTGLIYQGTTFPLYDKEEKLFDTCSGAAYVITHECDIDQSNVRAFNDYVLVCPIICFNEFALSYSDEYSAEDFFKFIPDLAANRIFRVLFIPPHSEGFLPAGGIVYLNQICNTHIETFALADCKSVCALSEYAQRIMDFKLRNHLLRPKSDPLPRYH